MPQRRRQQAPITIRARVPRRRRRTKTNHTTVSVVIKTVTLKTRHNKEEIYPIPIKDIISRANVGNDADIHALGYTLSVSLATGNDLATVTANLGHSGPWVRRGQSANDSFNQQSNEHDFKRSKSVIFKVNLKNSEREYINPDTTDNFLNLRIRDPCGVVPGVTAKLECRFRLRRPTPSTTFLDAGTVASDLYEDQDVSTGTVQPPAALMDIPAVIKGEGTFSKTYTFTTSDTTSPFTYNKVESGTSNINSFTITAAGKINKVGEFTAGDLQTSRESAIKAAYTADGFEGDLAIN